MATLKQQTINALEAFLSFLEESPWKDKYYFSVKELCLRLDEPCVLAVAGRVKAGKSSFINAFLGADLALTGTTETTATINYFRFGQPDDPSKPVRVIWMNGQVTWEDVDFLNSLQGNTIEILQKASGIKRLEFFVNNPKLERVRLVDTPGTGAIVGEDGAGHENVTRDFFNLHQQLRERHNQETTQISSEADAVIYLNGAAVGQVSDAAFLQDFQGDNASLRSFNTIGVMSKIDLNDDILENRERYADDMAAQYGKVLSMPIRVLPVSSGIQRYIDTHSDEEMLALQSKLKNGFAAGRLSLALKSDKIFKAPSLPGCTLSVEERQKMCAGLPWRVFVVLARELANKELPVAKSELIEKAGFGKVSDVLEHHFFKRGVLLRCHTVLKDAYALVQKLHRIDLYEYQRSAKALLGRIDTFEGFVRNHPDFSEDGTGEDLLKFLRDHAPQNRYEELKSRLESIEDSFEQLLFKELASANRDYDGLRLLDESADSVSQEEKVELQELFGLLPATNENITKEYCIKRQMFWRQLSFSARSAKRKEIGSLAEVQYGRKISALIKQEVS